ncbi:MAG: STAS domain-containing protein [Actinomycetota bacterium]
MELKIDSKTEGARTVITLAGEVDLSTAPALRERLAGLIDGGATSLVVDLRQVTFMDSTGLGVLMGAHLRIHEQDGELRLVASEGPVLRVLTLAKLTDLFPVSADLPDDV